MDVRPQHRRNDSKESQGSLSLGDRNKRFNPSESYQEYKKELQALREQEKENLLPEPRITLESSQQKRVYDRWTVFAKREIDHNISDFHKFVQELGLDHQQMKDLSNKSFAKIENMVKGIAAQGATSEYIIKKLKLQSSLVQPFRGAYTVLTGRSHGRQISSWKLDAEGYLEQNLESTLGQAYKDNKWGKRNQEIDK